MPATIFDRETHPSVRLSECEKDFSQNASNHFRSGNCRSCYCRSCYCRSCYCRSCYCCSCYCCSRYCCSCYCCSRRPGTPYIHPLCSRAYETRSGRNRKRPLSSRDAFQTSGTCPGRPGTRPWSPQDPSCMFRNASCAPQDLFCASQDASCALRNIQFSAELI